MHTKGFKLDALSKERGRIDSGPLTVYKARGIRRVDPTHRWRGGRVAEGGGLLNRYTVNSRIVGSNPIPSATIHAARDSFADADGPL